MRLRTRYTQRLPVAPGLRLDIPMFEGSGTKVLDLSGKGNHGTITDAVWTRDENGVAMSFNGTSAYINCGNDSSLDITDAITIEMWVKPIALGESAPTYRYIVIKSLSYVIVYNVADDGLTARIYSGTVSKSAHKIIAQSTFENNWWHIALVSNSTTIKLYVNGNEEDSNPSGVIDVTVNDLIIGSQEGTSRFWNGTIDEVRIYAVALTADQIKRRYEQTKRDYVRGS